VRSRSRRKEVLKPNSIQMECKPNEETGYVSITMYTEPTKPLVLPVSVQRHVERLRGSGICKEVHASMWTEQNRNVLFCAVIKRDEYWRRTARTILCKTRSASFEVYPRGVVKRERDKYVTRRRAGRSRFSPKRAAASAR
jgi:hypothetical protein